MGLGNQAWLSSTLWRGNDDNSGGGSDNGDQDDCDGGTDGEVDMLVVMEMIVMAEMSMMMVM